MCKLPVFIGFQSGPPAEKVKDPPAPDVPCRETDGPSLGGCTFGSVPLLAQGALKPLTLGTSQWFGPQLGAKDTAPLIGSWAGEDPPQAGKLRPNLPEHSKKAKVRFPTSHSSVSLPDTRERSEA